LVIDHMLMVIDYSFVNQFWKQCWLMVIDYYLLVIDYQRVKLFGKRFCEKFLCYSMFWKTFLVLILIESFLDSWILSLKSWSWLFLNLDSWNLIESWNLIVLESWFFETWFLKLFDSWFFETCLTLDSLVSSK